MQLDDYVCDVLMRDLLGHDRAPSAFFVYLYLTYAGGKKATVEISYQELAEVTGLSKSAVQAGVRRLVKRKLVTVEKATVTATPLYTVQKPWMR
jgi:DNA-binding transcriptional regulator GbsR (MarR family)